MYLKAVQYTHAYPRMVYEGRERVLVVTAPRRIKYVSVRLKTTLTVYGRTIDTYMNSAVPVIYITPWSSLTTLPRLVSM